MFDAAEIVGRNAKQLLKRGSCEGALRCAPHSTAWGDGAPKKGGNWRTNPRVRGITAFIAGFGGHIDVVRERNMRRDRQ